MTATQGAVLVVGGGVMGSGIALTCALARQSVLLVDVDEHALEKARSAVESRCRFLADVGLAPASAKESLDGVQYVLPHELAGSEARIEICFEAVPDDLSLKRAVIADLRARLRPQVPIASNSGNLAVDDIAAPLPDRGWVLSAHWVNPPHLMPVVEVAPGTDTQPAAVDAVCRFLELVGRRPVRLRRDIPGRIANRLHFALLNEAIRLLDEDVAGADDIDAVCRASFVARMALFGTLGAHDVYGRKHTSYQNFAYLHAATGNPVYQPTALHQRKIALEARGDVEASRWRPDADLPARVDADRRVADLLRYLDIDGTGR